jgi:Flp pilus assembly pilin Flp
MMATFRLWLWRLFLAVVLVVVYSILPDPLDTLFGILTGLAFALWLYQRATGRFNLRPLPVKFERVETVTLTHVLLGLILLVMIATFSESAKLKNETSDIQSSITDLQNSASDNTDEIKSSLDDVKSAIEANQ